jgi:hypothetical protein
MANTIGGFGGRNSFILVILSELTIEFIYLGFCKFARDFENPNGNAHKRIIIAIIRLCINLNLLV